MSSSDSQKKDEDAAPRGEEDAVESEQSLESNLQPIDPSVFRVETADGDDASSSVDIDAILAANTSQLIAMVAEASSKEEEKFDPFAPSSEAGDEPEDDAEGTVAESRVASEDEPLVEGVVSEENEFIAGETEDAQEQEQLPALEETSSAEVQEQQPEESVEAASASSAYSRENASYEHRTGWRSLGTGKKVLLSLILALAILLGIAAGVGFALFTNAQEQLALDEGIEESLTPVEADIDPYWMLVLGSDSRSESTDRARSDVLMLVRIDPQAPKVTMVSIPRDTKVVLEGYGTQKINAAYALGGAELAIKTVEDYSGVKISHYAEIYFTGFEDLVNQLGGVTVDVPEYCKYSDVELQPGVQTLTGHEALIFARCRKTYSEGDFTRTKCQRLLVEALVQKVLEKPVTELPEVVANTAKCFSTDIPLTDLVLLAQKMQSSGEAKFYSAMAPSTTGMIGNASYTFTYINQWKFLMQRAANGEDPTISDKEAEILGSESTAYSDMDMTTSIPEETMSALQTYWDEQAAKKAKKNEKSKKKTSQGEDSSSDMDSGSDSDEKSEE